MPDGRRNRMATLVGLADGTNGGQISHPTRLEPQKHSRSNHIYCNQMLWRKSRSKAFMPTDELIQNHESIQQKPQKAPIGILITKAGISIANLSISRKSRRQHQQGTLCCCQPQTSMSLIAISSLTKPLTAPLICVSLHSLDTLDPKRIERIHPRCS